MIKPRIFKGIIEFNREIADLTKQIRIRPQLEDVFDFEPGQFVTVTVAPMIKRSYSIASSPKQNYIDLIGDTKIGGPGSQFFANAKAGDLIELLGPLGQFTFKTEGKDCIFWATGTGIVPFLSMLENELRVKKNSAKLVLNCGFRYQNQIVAQAQMERLATEFQNFEYNLFLTRPEDGWQGKSGRITEYLNTYSPRAEEHYLCGAMDMINSVVSVLEEKGVKPEQIHYEKYY